jgi:hypothetical protein
MNNMNNQNEPTSEDEVMKQILEEINKYKNNQIEFKEAVIDFIDDMITTITPDDNNETN